jgi:Flp pilus assembly CpaF family ATPase
MSPTSANLPLADLRSMIASAVDYVIFQARIGGVRAPRQVIRLDGVTEQGQYRIQTIFER